MKFQWCYHLIFHKLIWFLSVSGDLSGKNVSSANHGARQYFATTTKNPRSAPACLWRQDWNLLISLNQISQNMLATSHDKTVLATWFHSLVIKSTTIFTDCFLQKVADILNTEYSLKCWHQMLKRYIYLDDTFLKKKFAKKEATTHPLGKNIYKRS